MSLNPKKAIYTSASGTPQIINLTAAAVSILAMLLTLVVVYLSWNGKITFIPLYVTIGLWAVVPPLWFWYEYFYIYREHGEPDTLELFKYGQDMSKAIWAGVLTALIAFAASDVFKAPKNNESKYYPHLALNQNAQNNAAPVGTVR